MLSLKSKGSTSGDGNSKTAKFRYTRPEFLQLRTDDEIIVSADHQIRPIILPRDVSRLPWKSGYAECINAGKSLRNEDQAACYQDVAVRQSSLLNHSLSDSIRDQIPWTYFGLFDGHAGAAVAVAASAQLHNIVSEKLRQVAGLLIALEFQSDDNKDDKKDDNEDNSDDEFNDCQSFPLNVQEDDTKKPNGVPCNQSSNNESVTVDSLITGALESAFWEMDAIIESDKHGYKMPGGCTAIVSVFILGKVYVCNAGDSRAIIYRQNKVIPMSFDFTPTSERERILRLGLQRPEFLGNEFTQLEFLKRPTRKDLGKQMLYKDAYMTGWSMKTITYDDLRFPLVWGEGKRSRVLATIGVTRGFGDHELRAQYGSVMIKPFLTPEPEVRVLQLEEDQTLTPEDVLIMGTDGLWDVTGNEEAAEIIRQSFDLFADNEESRSKYRYITAAQDLVIQSRGHTSNWNNVWRTGDDRLASLDDISVFVIPLKPYRDEYLEWKKLRTELAQNQRRSTCQQAPPTPSPPPSTN